MSLGDLEKFKIWRENTRYNDGGRCKQEDKILTKGEANILNYSPKL